MAMPLGTTIDQCRKICRDDRGMLPFYCKSFHYSDKSKLCLLSEHGPRSKVTNSSDFSYHESICIQGGKDNSNLKIQTNLDLRRIFGVPNPGVKQKNANVICEIRIKP